jgi:hypothetical protein
MKHTIYNHLNSGLIENGSRTASRTNELHSNIVKHAKELIPNFDEKYEIKYEHSIKCAYGNKFKIDIAVFNRDTNELHTCILAKGFVCSVGKNRANNANTTGSEVIRIKLENPNVNVWFVTFLSNVTAVYKNNGTLRTMEKISSTYVDMKVLFQKLKVDNPIYKSCYSTTVTYDLNNIDYSTKNSFRNTLNINNITNINTESFNEIAKKLF